MGTIVIAIDGPAATGKSTLARNLALKLGILHVDSGAFYRAVTWAFQKHQVDLTWEASIGEVLRHLKFETFVFDNHVNIEIAGQTLSDELRAAEVTGQVSEVASIGIVREFVTRQLRAIASTSDCVIEGRDIGSVVFPATPFKIYLDAPLDVRASRRHTQGLTDCIASRDKADKSRSISPLQSAAGALHVDVSSKTPEQVANRAMVLLVENGFPADRAISYQPVDPVLARK